MTLTTGHVIKSIKSCVVIGLHATTVCDLCSHMITCIDVEFIFIIVKGSATKKRK